jgi:methylmalonyl-CoA mutase C-terminal domain/subunit
MSGSMSAARPPEGGRAPSGGSDPQAVGERGGSVIPKVLVTKIGFDGHDRGSRVVAAALRDAGMEVIYTPPWQEIAAVVKLATEEDVDVVGISSLATDHLIVPKLMTALREAGLGDVGVVVGGIVPDDDETALLAAGVARVFHPGSAMSDIAAFVRELAARVRSRRVAA